MKIYHFNELDSTNNYLKNKNDIREWDVVIADVQTSGRGRRNSSWMSSNGAALFSFALKKDSNLSINEYLKLPLIVGLSLLKALESVEQLDYQFKWTNDIYLNDKKLSGILVEKVGDFFIIGIGININDLEIRKKIKIAISLKSITNKNYEILKIIETVITSFIHQWNNFLKGGWQEILFEINQKNYLLNKNIEIISGEDRVVGIGGKISDSGELEVKTVNGLKFFMIGEIHIKNIV